MLPSHYQLGDPTIYQDFRLTKNFVYRERYKLGVFGEVFNAFNIANLRGYGVTLDKVNANPALQTFAFGQPTQRALQTFGSAGPRAFQVGARFSFCWCNPAPSGTSTGATGTVVTRPMPLRNLDKKWQEMALTPAEFSVSILPRSVLGA